MFFSMQEVSIIHDRINGPFQLGRFHVFTILIRLITDVQCIQMMHTIVPYT